jgi:hypothetical protein
MLLFTSKMPEKGISGIRAKKQAASKNLDTRNFAA